MRQRLGIAQAVAGNPRLDQSSMSPPQDSIRRSAATSIACFPSSPANRIVLLSTHIVEDVAQLCPRFAIISHGRLVASTTPEQAFQAIEGSIFEASITAASYQELVSDPGRCVTQAYLVGGSNRVRIYQSEDDPPEGFMPVESTLEDVYLVVIKTGGIPGRDIRGTQSELHLGRRCLMSLAAAVPCSLRSLQPARPVPDRVFRPMPLIIPAGRCSGSGR